MGLTGNPFVEGGLAVATHLAGRSNPREVTLSDLTKTLGDGTELCRANSRLKSFTMIFGTNGPLTQPAYKKSGKNETIYKAVLRRLAEAALGEGQAGEPCELTLARTPSERAARGSRSESGSAATGFHLPAAWATMHKLCLQRRGRCTSALWRC